MNIIENIIKVLVLRGVAGAGRKKTGCGRRIIIKEDLVAEDKSKLVSSCIGPNLDYGKKRPFYKGSNGRRKS